MNRRKALIGSLAGIGGLVALLAASRVPLARDEPWWGHRGWWEHRRHGGFARLCAEGAGEHLDEALAEARGVLAIRADQAAYWDGFTSAVRDATGRLAEACPSAELFPELTAPEKLTRAETMMASGLDALRAVRPSFDALYAALDEVQRRELDRMFDRGHRA